MADLDVHVHHPYPHPEFESRWMEEIRVRFAARERKLDEVMAELAHRLTIVERYQERTVGGLLVLSAAIAGGALSFAFHLLVR